jgi:perosamine synthetase
VDSRSFFVPIHNQTVFHNKGLFTNEKHPESKRISKNGLYLLCSNKIIEDEIEYVCNIIKKTFEN